MTKLLFEGRRFKAIEKAQRIYVTDKKCGNKGVEFIGAHSFEQAKKRARNLANKLRRDSKKQGCYRDY